MGSTCQATFANEEFCRQIIDRTFLEFGKLDVLVNNAGFQMTHDSIEEFSTEEFDRTFNGSVIINTASMQRVRPQPEPPGLRS